MIDPIDLHAYVDGELNPLERSDVQRQIELSPESGKEIEAIQRLKSLVQVRSEEVSTSKAWSDCVRRLDELDKARRVERFVGRFAPALCGVFFIAIVLGGLVSRHHEAGGGSSRNLTAMIGRMHFDKTETNTEKSEWLNNLIKVSKLSTPDHLEPRQVDECEIDGMIVRRVLMRDANGDLSVLMIPKKIEFEGFSSLPGHPGYRCGQSWGRNCIVRPDGDRTTVITAERPYEELANVLMHIKVQ